ncbi:MAG: hypothetical protein Q8Q09_14095 [Deltaproteobacteria bacterium]|nr:hypothetical protein [Deltaproteobacteria bacterium]
MSKRGLGAAMVFLASLITSAEALAQSQTQWAHMSSPAVAPTSRNAGGGGSTGIEIRDFLGYTANVAGTSLTHGVVESAHLGVRFVPALSVGLAASMSFFVANNLSSIATVISAGPFATVHLGPMIGDFFNPNLSVGVMFGPHFEPNGGIVGTVAPFARVSFELALGGSYALGLFGGIQAHFPLAPTSSSLTAVEVGLSLTRTYSWM